MNGNTAVNNIDIMDFLNVLRKSVFAGMFIGIAGWGYLVNPVLGMFLFCVGLIGVIKYNLFLFTGSAGFIYEWEDVLWVIVCLFGNLIGCALIALLAQLSPYVLYSASTQIVEARLHLGWFNCGMLSICCGVLMSFAAKFSRRNSDLSDWLPLLFAVPTFIICGFPHCVADAFYNLVYVFGTNTSVIPFKEILIYYSSIVYSSIVVGNFIGCNCFRILS